MVSFGNRALVAASLAGSVAFGAVGLGVSAQDASPAGEMATAALPNHIHAGTCDNLDPAPLVPLADLVYGAADSAATPGASGGATPMADTAIEAVLGDSIPVAVATTEVDLALDDIIAGGHAINVHESVENIANYVACGNVFGLPDEQGNLFVGLGELNESGKSGVAWLLGDGEQTTVTVFLTDRSASMGQEAEGVQGIDEEGNAEGTPAA